MNKILVIISFAFGMLFSHQEVIAMENVIDSIGVKTIEGKQYIVHKVEPKETLYALSRRYQVTVNDILTSNEEVKDGYAIDQIGRILFIPIKASVQSASTSNPATIHTVKSGETLYSLARQYEVKVGQIKSWNDLTSNQLALGQELYVTAPETKAADATKEEAIKPRVVETKESKNITHSVSAGETIYRIARTYEVKEEDIKKWNKLSSNEIAIGQVLIIKTNAEQVVAEENVKPAYEDNSLQRFHLAKKGETYADVAEAYNLYLPDLEDWNNFEEPFTGGEVIKIVAPKEKAGNRKPTDAIATKPKLSPDSLKQKGIHIVKSGETIYKLSDLYKVDMEDLRKWNNLSNYQLSLGQRLYVKNPDAFKVEDAVVQEVDEEKNERAVVEIVKSADKTPVQDTKAYFTAEEEDIPKIEKVVEKGVAEVIAGSDNTEKYLALHRTAKIGTIMQVRNDLNDQIVFVRVLGKLPNTGVDQKVIIRISKKAFQKLGGVDYKFPVEISYLPLDD